MMGLVVSALTPYKHEHTPNTPNKETLLILTDDTTECISKSAVISNL